ncbi:hypothetical protein GSI_05645 [Ganoderma sinense ZZ0214-1]|uniref:Uncharacterized protein n=1 Tax=Ganoderma sinense ZZ0214-1 TaxID=1077348 RepID=A0A2G8SF64_9APHY|nr:hypothetical protein GSI_05645 [Ganoderma sinense ZZ0214-1]
MHIRRLQSTQYSQSSPRLHPSSFLSHVPPHRHQHRRQLPLLHLRRTGRPGVHSLCWRTFWPPGCQIHRRRRRQGLPDLYGRRQHCSRSRGMGCSGHGLRRSLVLQWRRPRQDHLQRRHLHHRWRCKRHQWQTHPVGVIAAFSPKYLGCTLRGSFYS